MNINITPKNLLVPAAGGEQVISCQADFDGSGVFHIEIDSAATFLTDLNIIYNEGRNCTFSVSAKNNASTLEKTGKIYITYDNYTVIYYITQSGYKEDSPYINVQPYLKLNYDDIKSSINVDISSLIDLKTVQVNSDSDWIKCDFFSNVINLTVEKNYGEYRTAVLTITGQPYDGSDEIASNVIVSQSGYLILPIFQDVYYNYITDSDEINYKLKTDEKIIYDGIAKKMPDSSYITFNLNKLCSNFLKSDLPSFFPTDEPASNVYINNDYYKNFKLLDGDDYVVCEYNFFNDWSYLTKDVINNINDKGEVILNCPIIKDNIIDRRQYLFYTFFVPKIGSTRYYFHIIYRSDSGEASSRISVELSKPTQYMAIDNSFRRPDMQQYNKIECGNDIYFLKETCADYCLYYFNAFGGVDYLLVKGNVTRKDNIEQNFYKKVFNNNKPEFSKKNYLNLVTSEYTLYTQYLSDEESNRMWHLLESPQVYLHNLNTDEIIPVNITDTTCEFKTFKNQGNKKFYYVINVEASQEKLRKNN